MSNVKLRAKLVVKMKDESMNMSYEYDKGTDLLAVISSLCLNTGLHLISLKTKLNERLDFAILQDKGDEYER